MVEVPPGCPLTEIEYETVAMIASGMSYREIAVRAGRSISTVRSTVSRAYLRLGIAGSGRRQGQLIARMFVEGWGDSVEDRALAVTDQATHERERADRAEARLARLIVRARKRGLGMLAPGQALYLTAWERRLREKSNDPEVEDKKSLEQALCLRAMFHEADWRSTDAGGPEVIPPWEKALDGEVEYRREENPKPKLFSIMFRKEDP